MFSNWFQKDPNKIGFEDIKYAMEHLDMYIIISTLGPNEQGCLIKGTLSLETETVLMNNLIEDADLHVKTIIVYGKNAADSSADKKYHQLRSLGFSKLAIYSGGLFEWVLLQDIYGSIEFPTTGRELDLLKYRPPKTYGKLLIKG